jgi:response regulator RpfG family c-di-GMP phosphodiesterase
MVSNFRRRWREVDAEQVIFITGGASVLTCVQAMKAGAVDYLPKPFLDENLLSAVKRALERSSEQWLQHSQRKGMLDRLAMLTPREFDVLKGVNCRHAQQTNCFATRHNRGNDQGPSRARYGEDGYDIRGGARDPRAEGRDRTDVDGCY